MLGVMLCYKYGFVLVMFEGTYLGSFNVSFDGTVDNVGGDWVGLTVVGIMTDL